MLPGCLIYTALMNIAEIDDTIWEVLKYNYIYMLSMIIILFIMNMYWLSFLIRIAYFGIRGYVKNEYDDKHDSDHQFSDKSQNYDETLISKVTKEKEIKI